MKRVMAHCCSCRLTGVAPQCTGNRLDELSGSGGQFAGAVSAGSNSHRRDCHSAAPHSPFSRRINRDDEGVPAKSQNYRRRLGSKGFIGNAVWSGPRLVDVLAAASVRAPPTPQHGLSSNTMALITSDCGAIWP